jgi:hypothetical protein
MSEQPPATKRVTPRRRNVGRVLGNIAVAIVILAVMAGAFALSYTPVRDIARDAGVTSPVVRIYPGILDAVFLVCCVCALMLRNARWWTRLFAWLSVLVTGALIGAADVYHATGLRLPRRTLDGTVWALPWALVLLAFSLWISTLQHTKSDHDPRTSEPDDRPAPDAPVLALEATPAARAALPAPGADEASATQPVTAGSRARTGGLAEVGLGQPAATGEVAQAEPAQAEQAPEPAEPAKAEETTGAEQAVTTEVPEEAEKPAVAEEAPVVAEPPAAGEPIAGEAPVVVGPPVAGEAAEAGKAEAAGVTEEVRETEEAGLAEEPRETPEPQAEVVREAEQASEARQADYLGTPSATEESQEAVQASDTAEARTAEDAGGAAVQAGDAGDAAQAGDAVDAKDAAPDEDPVDAKDAIQAEGARQAAHAVPAEEPEDAREAVVGHETTEAGEMGEMVNADAATPAPEAATPVAALTADDDTPAYGFPVVTEQDVDREMPRMPTLLGAPVPADMADPVAADPAAADPAAKGKPPAASAELPVTEAELAHEDQPDQEPTPSAQSTPPETPAPNRFERVRSTPRRPGG